MTYEIFKELVLQHMKLFLIDGQRVRLETFHKNNNVTLDGIVIIDDLYNISPTIYLKPFYDKYKNGRTVKDICLEIYNIYEDARPSQSIDVGFFNDFSLAKEHIVLKLVNFEDNEEILEDVPHIRFLDLALCFSYYVNIDNDFGAGTILIHDSHLEMWDVTIDELYEIALKNTRITLSPTLTPLVDLIKRLREKSGEDYYPIDIELTADDVPLYVVHNEHSLYGAVFMSDINYLKSISDIFGCDLIIMPSSIHEFIVLPVSESDAPLEFYNSMVNEININEVPETDVLSDHAYYYSRIKNKITY